MLTWLAGVGKVRSVQVVPFQWARTGYSPPGSSWNPPAQASVGENAATASKEDNESAAPSRAGRSIDVTVHVLPFQCSARGSDRLGPVSSPTAHASVALGAETA